MKIIRLSIIAFATIVASNSLLSTSCAQSVTSSPVADAIRNDIDTLETHKSTIESALNSLQIKLDGMAQLRIESIQKQDSIGISADSFAEIMKMLQSQRIQLMIDLAGLGARREALAEAKSLAQDESNIESLVPLRKILAIAKQGMGDVRDRFESGAQSQADLLSAQTRVLTIEVQIADTVAKHRNSNFSSRLNSDLLDASLERAEKQARLETTESLLDTLKESRVLVENTTVTRNKIEAGRDQIQQLQTEMMSLESQINLLQRKLSDLK